MNRIQMNTENPRQNNDPPHLSTRCLPTDHDAAFFTCEESDETSVVIVAPNSAKGEEYLLAKLGCHGSKWIRAERAFNLLAEMNRAGLVVYVGDASEFPDPGQ
jgi:hypothetical protein